MLFTQVNLDLLLKMSEGEVQFEAHIKFFGTAGERMLDIPEVMPKAVLVFRYLGSR